MRHVEVEEVSYRRAISSNQDQLEYLVRYCDGEIDLTLDLIHGAFYVTITKVGKNAVRIYQEEWGIA